MGSSLDVGVNMCVTRKAYTFIASGNVVLMSFALRLRKRDGMKEREIGERKRKI